MNAMAVTIVVTTRSNGGEGIRTPETLTGLPVFKTGAFNHSATPPWGTESIRADQESRDSAIQPRMRAEMMSKPLMPSSAIIHAR